MNSEPESAQEYARDQFCNTLIQGMKSGRIAIGKDDRDWFHSPVTRRAFVGLAGQGAVVVALSGLIRFFEPKGFRIIRPPGAVIEEEFLSLCIRCDKCREACPWEIIRPILLTESIISAGTPILEGHCLRCWLCIPVCPTGALLQ